MNEPYPQRPEGAGPAPSLPPRRPGPAPEADALAAEVLSVLRAALRESPTLRHRARQLAEWLLASAGAAAPPAPPPAPPPPPPTPMPAEARIIARPARPAAPGEGGGAGPVLPLSPPVVRGPLQPVPLKMGGTTRPVLVRGTSNEIDAARAAAAPEPVDRAVKPPPAASEPLPDLHVVAERCRVKAEACRWAARRRALLASPAPPEADVKAADAELLARARALPHCYLWTFDPAAVLPDDAALEDLAGAYDNLAAAAELTHDLWVGDDPDRTTRDESYKLLAEAQSAVRIGVLEAARRADRDQDEVFRWLRTRTFEDRVLVGRHMRLDDPAPVAAWEGLRDRLAELRRATAQVRDARRQRKELFGKARYAAKMIAKGSSLDPLEEWRRLAGHVEAILALGVPPSDVDLREIVLPLVEQEPEGFEPPPGLARVIDEVDRYLASREEAQPPDQAETRSISPQLRRAAELLHGKAVVLIGGERRAQSAAALEQALGLKELRWISTRAHQSIAGFEPLVAREDTALVMLAIRWSSHSFEGVREMCARHGKPFVRLPRGYNPNQVAAEILNQVSDRLGG